ncbi:MAG: hypothetical protein SYC29_12465 [Planctomycetota bacterium]|nr:hypothetical protein [Planctomycetota bacterium]
MTTWHTLDPDTFYTAFQLNSLLDIPEQTIENARKNGRLAGTTPAGGRSLYLGADVNNWLAAGAPSRPKAPSRSTSSAPAPQPGRRAPTTKSTPKAATAPPSAAAQFEERVKLRMQSGLSRRAAVRTTAVADPELRRAMVAEANQDRPRAAIHRTAKTTAESVGNATARWNSLISAQVSRGVPRAEAVRRLTRAEPALRTAMLGEANANRPKARIPGDGGPRPAA